ncbi:putative phage abortive infection protein [Algoriphagus marinus]|uniref:putative phage abortive infection protein n=1 Tax=Algoriphagus marinus TaxID=1925762 RepID=UPI000AFDEA8E|nr:putative phage abortive infection protein [Algoriphagus marinus]
MIKLLKFLKLTGYLLTIVGVILTLFIVFNKVYFNTSMLIDRKLASDFGSFFGGFVGTIFAILSVVLIVYTIVSQNVENRKTSLKDNFFKMIDYHNQNVSQISVPNLDTKKDNFEVGRRAFVVYKIQLKRLLSLINEIDKKKKLGLKDTDIIDIAYIIFFYGLQGSWNDFISEKLNRYDKSQIIIKEIIKEIENKPNINIGRTNQTNLSTYFRNMYNAIKLIDNSDLMSDGEKKELIKIYRAQLSNPELYIIFFNIISRFGNKWIERRYVNKYEFLKNIPKDYCDGYSPKKFFPMEYEYEEY